MIKNLLSIFYTHSLKQLLARTKHGELTLITPENDKIHYRGSFTGPVAELHIRDWRTVKDFFKHGEIGILKSYQKGLIDTPNLSSLLKFGISNQQILQNIIDVKGWRKKLLSLYHRLRKNSVTGSKKNIEAHYDLSNSFFELWLDPSMVYSSALFTPDTLDNLEKAQEQKLERILSQLNLPEGSHILEIGCGWGAFCELAARRGYKVTGITISKKQLDYSKERIARHNLEDRVNILYCDYRELDQKFDAIVSIEMFEAVGEEYWSTYFETLNKCLKPGGKAVIQTITIDENHFETYKQTPDFIQLYVFPGGMLPSPGRFCNGVNDAGLTVYDQFSFGKDYANTLQLWLKNFNAKLQEIRALGFKDDFIRLWQFYLSYCIAGFESERTDVIQFTLIKQ